MPKSLKIQRETLDNLKRLICNAIKSSNDWKAFYDVAPLSEAYLRRDSEIHVHIFSATGINFPDFCAVFQRHPCPKLHARIGKCKGETFPANCSYCVLSKGKGYTPDSHGDNLNQAMFVGVIDLMQRPQRTVALQIPSMV